MTEVIIITTLPMTITARSIVAVSAPSINFLTSPLTNRLRADRLYSFD